jgi:hypothetical protein
MKLDLTENEKIKNVKKIAFFTFFTCVCEGCTILTDIPEVIYGSHLYANMDDSSDIYVE